jgi:hypothetical protein
MIERKTEKRKRESVRGVAGKHREPERGVGMINLLPEQTEPGFCGPFFTWYVRYPTFAGNKKIEKTKQQAMLIPIESGALD